MKHVDLIKLTNDYLPQGYKIEYQESADKYALIRLDGIQTDEGIEDEYIADIFDMESFSKFLTEVEDVRTGEKSDANA